MGLEKEAKNYTFADYLTWPDNERWEIIDGVAYNMSQSPSTNHQIILGELSYQIANYLKGKPCKVLAAPLDVRFPKDNDEDDQIDTVVQLDLIIVCEIEKLDKKGCKGPPTMVIEIISPATSKKDTKEKLLLYERSLIKEYWIVYPEELIVSVFKLDENNKYARAESFGFDEKVKVSIFDDLEIDLSEVELM